MGLRIICFIQSLEISKAMSHKVLFLCVSFKLIFSNVDIVSDFQTKPWHLGKSQIFPFITTYMYIVHVYCFFVVNIKLHLNQLKVISNLSVFTFINL